MAKNSKLNEYVSHNLARELSAIKAISVTGVLPEISVEERTLIYKYSEDGYEHVNRLLRDSEGKSTTEFGELLDNTLKKLPNFQGLVYRSANLSNAELGRYTEACQKNIILVEYSFVSTSKSISMAGGYGKRCHFTIISKTGKEIEAFAKYGRGSGQNEKEVLFRPNRSFNVLEVTNNNNVTFIIME